MNLRSRIAPVIACASLIVAGFAFVPAAASNAPLTPNTTHISALGGSKIIYAVVKNARTCVWTSSPRIARFDVNIKCTTGEIARSAHFSANPSNIDKRYTITLIALGSKTTTDRWNIVEAGKSLPSKPIPTTTTTSVAPTTTTVPTTIPGSSYLMTWPLPPTCPASAEDADVCDVKFAAGGTIQVVAGEEMLFNLGWADATEQSCDAYASDTTTTMTIAGRAVGVVSVACQFVVSDATYGITNLWVTDARYLSPALPPGTYSADAVLVVHTPIPYTTGCVPTPPAQSCFFSAGTYTFPVSVAVS